MEGACGGDARRKRKWEQASPYPTRHTPTFSSVCRGTLILLKRCLDRRRRAHFEAPIWFALGHKILDAPLRALGPLDLFIAVLIHKVNVLYSPVTACISAKRIGPGYRFTAYTHPGACVNAPTSQPTCVYAPDAVFIRRPGAGRAPNVKNG